MVAASEKYQKKQQQKKMIIRVLACVLCVGLVVMMIVPYLLY